MWILTKAVSYKCVKINHMTKQVAVFVLVVAIAALFRFYDIKNIPPGLYPDEAMNGNNAIQALEDGPPEGGFKIFYPENNGREGLFINIQALSLKIFGYHPWALRIVSAMFGILTVVGVFLMGRQLFNWQVGAISSFLLAVSFWHTLFSRIGFRAIMAPFFLVWAAYFLLKGLRKASYWYFSAAGFFYGLGFYSYLAYRITPFIIIFTLAAYWASTKRGFSHSKYGYAKARLARLTALFIIATIITTLPIAYYFWTHQGDFFGRAEQISVLASSSPLKQLIINAGQTLGMFNFVGDFNWRHNLAGEPMLFWPVGIMFTVGLLRCIVNILFAYRKHGHANTIDAFLVSWFFIGLVPVILSNEGLPHALRSIIIVPPVFLIAGEAIWWVYEKVKHWSGYDHNQAIGVYHFHLRESSFFGAIFIIAILGSTAIMEFDKYFFRWALNPEVSIAYDHSSTELSYALNQLGTKVKKYVVVNQPGVLVNGIPMPAQTIMFITNTSTIDRQKAKNLYYLTEQDFTDGRYDKKASIFLLKNGNQQTN